MSKPGRRVRLLVLSNATGVQDRGKTFIYDRFARRFGGYGEKFDTLLTLLPEASSSIRPSSELPPGLTPVWLPKYHSRTEFIKRLPGMFRVMWPAVTDADVVLVCIPLLHGFPALLLSVLRRKPVIVLMIGSWANAGRPNLQGRGNSNRARRLFGRLASNAFAALASKLLVHGLGQDELIRPLRSKAIAVVESTLRNEDISLPERSPNRGLRLICVGRLVATKRYDVALKALKVLRDRGRAATLVLVGEGPERPVLELLTKRLSIEQYARFEGFVDDRVDLQRHYRAAFALLLPSETEGLSLAVMEAMAAGTSVISTAVGGMEAFLESGIDSIVLDETDAVKFADAVELLIEDPERRLKMIEAAQEKVRGLTHEEWVERLDSIVRETVRPA